MWFIFLGLITFLVATIYVYVKQCHQYYQKRGIPVVKPTFFFGNTTSTTLGKVNFGESLGDIYRQFPDCKYMGYYKFLTPAVLIRDPDLFHEMLIKDFQHFSDNELMVDENVDYIMSKNLFVLKGHQWKAMRALLSPMFSSGKLKYIFPLTEEVSQKMTKFIRKEIAANRGVCIDGKMLCYRFTIDNVATCAFGLDAKSFEGETQFFMAVRSFNDMSYLNAMKLFFAFMFPKLNAALKIRFFKEDVEEYLTGVVAQTWKYRKENNIVRNDFFDQITSLKEKSVDYPFTDRDVVAQGGSFFVDAVETSTNVTTWVLMEIARHPEVQKRVRDEINKVKAANNGSITYEGLSSLTYLEAVINETLRMNNPFGAFFKVCTKTYTLPEVSETNSARLTLNPGDSVLTSIDGINKNPDFFPDPHTFKPERFLDENKDNLVKNTFFPFGIGPRFCIGMRFALLQIKMIVISVIGDFQLNINDKMLPLKVHPNSLIKAPLNGFWFDLSELSKKDN